MHKPVVSKIRVLPPNKHGTKFSNKSYLHYIATRPGVHLTNGMPDLSEVQEQSLSIKSTEDEYIRYIAKRPRSHGLFGNIDTSNLSALESQMLQLSKKQLVYRGIISLSETDAVELGYTTASKWQELMKSIIADVAAEFNVPTTRLNWVAAFHQEETHPHVHYMFWDNELKPRSPYIHVSKQNRCREIISGEIFRAERERTAAEKTIKRDLILEYGQKLLNIDENAISDIYLDDVQTTNKTPDYIYNASITKNIAPKLKQLAEELPSKGRITYKLISPDIKSTIDDIVTSVLTSSIDIQQEYQSYLLLAEQIANTYSPSAKTYSHSDYKIIESINNADKDLRKRMGNIILKEAKRLRETPIHIPPKLLSEKEYVDTQEKSFDLLKAEAKTGNSYAQYTLGHEYLFGKEKNIRLGKEYLILSHENGCEQAKLLLDFYQNMQSEQLIQGSFQIFYSTLDALEKSNRYQEAQFRNRKKAVSKQAAKELAKKSEKTHLH